ncbi:MAG: arylesterase, partial [Planctomycetota bacterium]
MISLRLVQTALLAAIAVLLFVGCGDADSQRENLAENSPKTAELGDGYAEGSSVVHPPLEIPDDAPTVLFLGDSITAGLHLSPDDAFPAAVQRQLMEYGSPFKLVNAGVSGDTTRGGLARLPFVLKNAEPNVVVVELGANDGLRGQSLEATEANLREIIETCRGAGATVMLLGMNVPTNLGDYAKDFAEMYMNISSDLDVIMVPEFLRGVGGIPEMNLEDGMH